MVAMFGKMSNAVNQQMNSLDTVKMAQSMDMLNQQMDNMMINNKMMGELMNQDSLTEDATADQMLNVLKQEIALEDSNNLNVYVPKQEEILSNKQNLNQQQQQQYNKPANMQQPQQQQQQQANYDPFLDELKDLWTTSQGIKLNVNWGSYIY